MMTDLFEANSPAASPDPGQTAAMGQDDEAYLAFYRRERPRLCRTLSLLTADTRFVDDAAQEALLIARQHWAKIKDYEKPEAWLLKVALRILRRQQARDRRHLRPLDDGDDPEDAHASEAYAWSDDHQDLVSAVRLLPPRQRDAVVLFYFRELLIAQVADILGVAEGTVKAQLFAGRARLEQLLAPGRKAGGRDDAR